MVALERATLYGLVVYSNRRVNFGRVDPAAAREIFIREALVAASGRRKLPFLAHNRKLVAQVEELEHKSRRQDVLVDDELIYAFYDQQLPADVCSGASFERWYRDEVKRQPEAAAPDARRADAPRGRRHHHRRPSRRRIRLGGIDCAASYLHEPGDAEGRRHGHGADLRAEPGERGALRVAGAGHAARTRCRRC